VSRELFADVQSLWENRQESPESRANSLRSGNILVRKVFCGHCGYTMSRTRHGETQHGYKCNTQQTYDKSDCKLVSINENELKAKLLSMLRDQGADLRVQDVRECSEELYKAELREVNLELDRNSRFFKGLYESLVNGDISEAEYKELRVSYETKITTLNEKIKNLRDAAHDRIRLETRRKKASVSMQAAQDISGLTAEVVDSLIARIRVFEDKGIKVKFTFSDKEYAWGEAAVNE
jgi:hypothetical protein